MVLKTIAASPPHKSPVGQVQFACDLDLATWEAGPECLPEGLMVKLLFVSADKDPSAAKDTNNADDKSFTWSIILLKYASEDTFERIGICGRAFIETDPRSYKALSKVFFKSVDANYYIV
jgi:hypothetical protein